jgi:hypothetical protein
MDVDENGAMSGLRYWSEPDNRHEVALYTTPPAPQPAPVKTYHDGKPWPVAPKPWVGLTDEEIDLFINGRGDEDDDNYVEPTGDGFGLTDADLMTLVRRAEAKLKGKNT